MKKIKPTVDCLKHDSPKHLKQMNIQLQGNKETPDKTIFIFEITGHTKESELKGKQGQHSIGKVCITSAEASVFSYIARKVNLAVPVLAVIQCSKNGTVFQAVHMNIIIFTCLHTYNFILTVHH